MSEENSGLKVALNDSRANSERLHHESELVVQNVNTWVREQKSVTPLLTLVSSFCRAHTRTCVRTVAIIGFTFK